jgi:hypothetical protein
MRTGFWGEYLDLGEGEGGRYRMPDKVDYYL